MSSAMGLLRSLDVTNVAALVSFSYQVFNSVSGTNLSENIGHNVLDLLSKKGYISRILGYLFMSYLASSICTLVLKYKNFKKTIFVMKIFDLLLLAFNLFLLKTYLGADGKQLELTVCNGLKRVLPREMSNFFPASQICASVFTTFDQISSGVTKLFSFFPFLWNILTTSSSILSGFLKPTFAILNVIRLLFLFLGFVFFEPMVFFCDLLEPIGLFTSDSEVMKKKSVMTLSLAGCTLLCMFSLNLLYYYTIEGAEVLFPSGVSLMLWILVGFSFCSGLYKIFTHDPSGPYFTWTITQAAALLFYQCSTVAALHEILSVTGFVLSSDLWWQSEKIAFGTGFFFTMRLGGHLLLLLSIFWAYLVSWNPDIPDYIDECLRSGEPEKSKDEASSESAGLAYIWQNSGSVFDILLIFLKPIIVAILYIFVEKKYTIVESSPSSGPNFSYPTWLLLVAMTLNLLSSFLSAVYWHWARDPVADADELEKERLLRLFQGSGPAF